MSAIRDCSRHGEWVDDGTTVECPECIADDQVRVLRLVVDDYDRRRSTRWGRFLLWLLRRTT